MNKMIILVATIFTSIALTYLLFFNFTKPGQKQKGDIIAPVTKEFSNIKFDDLKSVNITPTSSTIYNLQFKLPNNTPANLPVYDYQPAIVEQNLTETLISKNNLKKWQTVNSKADGQIILSNRGAVNLNIYVSRGYYIYTDETEYGAGSISRVQKFTENDNVDDYRKAAEDFLKNKLELDLSQYQYNYFAYIDYPGPHLDVVNQKAQSGAIQFIYRQTSNNVPVYSSYKLYPYNQIAVVITKSKRVIRVDAKFAGRLTKLDTTVSLKSQEELEADIKARKANLISTSDLMFEDDIINSANITAVNLIYLERNGKLLPVYTLQGTVVSDKGQSMEADFLINAVKE